MDGLPRIDLGNKKILKLLTTEEEEKNMRTPILETDRLILREVRIEDVDNGLLNIGCDSIT